MAKINLYQPVSTHINPKNINMKNWFLLFIAVLFTASTQAQELKVKVTMNTPKLQTADPAVFQTLAASHRGVHEQPKMDDRRV